MENLKSKNKHLTGEEISKASTMKLIFRMEYLHAQSIFKPNKDAGISTADLEEAAVMAKELKYTLEGLIHLNKGKK